MIFHQAGRNEDWVDFFDASDGHYRRLLLARGQEILFAENGTPILSSIVRDARGEMRRDYLAFDPSTGQVGKPLRPVGYDDVAGPEPALNVAAKGPEVRLAVLGGKPEEFGLVTTDGAAPALSPTNDAVAYLSGGGAYVRTLVRIDRKAYDAAMVEAGRQHAVRLANEAGTALSLYASDADDAFPPAGDIPRVVGPYARTRDPLDALVYGFGGGVPSGDRAITELGYVPGPGGRAVIYADGHITWVPTP